MKSLNENQTDIQVPDKKVATSMAPRWAAALGALSIGLLYAALPDRLTIGPSWLLLVLESALLIPLLISNAIARPLRHEIARILIFTVLALVTVALMAGVILFVVTLPSKGESEAKMLLRTAALLWAANILVFALWYWEIDGGGPKKRHEHGHQAADFMFPQQADGNAGSWVPHFFDYLFIAFTGATALSPADTFPLKRRAKGLMMIEAVNAMVILAIIIGRIVNIL